MKARVCLFHFDPHIGIKATLVRAFNVFCFFKANKLNEQIDIINSFQYHFHVSAKVLNVFSLILQGEISFPLFLFFNVLTIFRPPHWVLTSMSVFFVRSRVRVKSCSTWELWKRFLIYALKRISHNSGCQAIFWKFRKSFLLLTYSTWSDFLCGIFQHLLERFIPWNG